LRILGIDPGLAIVGFGVVDVNNGKIQYVNHGTVLTEAGEAFQNRLLKVSQDLRDIITLYQPEHIVFEELFFAKNVKTALQVAAARGCAISAAAAYTQYLYEYTPMQIKQALVGYGRADKKQIQAMVKLLLRLEDIPRPDDAADALAVAITHANSGYAKEQFRMK